LEIVQQMSNGGSKKPKIRVLPNQYDVRTKLARGVLAELRDRYGDLVVTTVVNFNTKLKEGTSYGQPIVEFAPASAGARDFQKLAREILSDEPVLPTTDDLLRHVEQMAVEAESLLATTATLIPKTATQPVPAAPAPKPQAVPTSAKPAKPKAAPVTTAPAPQPVPPVATHEEIVAKIQAIYGVQQTPEGVVFRNANPGAQHVQLAGDFNDWMPHTTPLMRESGRGDFVTRLRLAPGRYRYRLVIDGRWSHDPANPTVETNEFGELNSILEVR
ncbi:MAG: hypothetical protein ACE5GE_16975, partial [Phycisphaerae bacterium]